MAEELRFDAITRQRVRSVLTAPLQVPSAREPKAVYGFRPFPKHGGIVTNELIDKLREDDAY